MFTVVMTEIPASISSRTSCQRFSWRPEPGTLVWASSSTSATVGFRARTASRSISSKVDPRYSTIASRDGLESLAHLDGVRPAVALDEADHDVGATLEPALALVEHGVGLADACDRSEVDPEAPGFLDDAYGVLVDLSCRGVGHAHSLDPAMASKITGAGPGGGLRSRHRIWAAENVHPVARESAYLTRAVAPPCVPAPRSTAGRRCSWSRGTRAAAPWVWLEISDLGARRRTTRSRRRPSGSERWRPAGDDVGVLAAARGGHQVGGRVHPPRVASRRQVPRCT